MKPIKTKYGAIFLLLAMTMLGCHREQPGGDLVETPLIVSSFRAVLENRGEFYSTDIGQNLCLKDIKKAVSDDDFLSLTVDKFVAADLENDGVAEIILRLTVNGNDALGFLILRYEDRVIYGYTLWARSFGDLKDDGTFSFSGGAADNGFGTLSFTDCDYLINKISYCESSFDIYGNMRVSFFVDGQKAEKDEFLLSLERQCQKKDAAWLDFTEDNVEIALKNMGEKDT